MTDLQKSMVEKLGLSSEDFQPKEDQTTIQDVVDALNVLTEIVLGGSEE